MSVRGEGGLTKTEFGLTEFNELAPLQKSHLFVKCVFCQIGVSLSSICLLELTLSICCSAAFVDLMRSIGVSRRQMTPVESRYFIWWMIALEKWWV